MTKDEHGHRTGQATQDETRDEGDPGDKQKARRDPETRDGPPRDVRCDRRRNPKVTVHNPHCERRERETTPCLNAPWNPAPAIELAESPADYQDMRSPLTRIHVPPSCTSTPQASSPPLDIAITRYVGQGS